MNLAAGACVGQPPENWDTDFLRSQDPDRVIDAIEECRACQLLLACRRTTEQLVAQGLPPRTLVQAARIWDSQGAPTTVESFLATAGTHRDRDRRLARAAS